jgi:hypothetical protein
VSIILQLGWVAQKAGLAIEYYVLHACDTRGYNRGSASICLDQNPPKALKE